MNRRYVLTVTFVALTACSGPTITISSELSPGLTVRAKIDSRARKFDPGRSKIRGKIIIENRSNYSFSHTNKRLWLSIGDSTSRRTYVDNLASHIVDTGLVTISPGENLEFPAYWIFPDTVVRSLSEQEISIYLAIP